MTQDLRQPSPASGETSTGLAAPQRLVVRVLLGSSFAFLAAGIWMLFAQPDFLPPDMVPILAFAFIAVAVSDWLAVRLLSKVWRARGKDSA